MVLKIQVISLIVSFCYGIFFYITLELSSKILYMSNLLVRVMATLLFVLFHTLLYFLLLMKINYGYIHIYFFLSILLGYVMCKVIYKRFVKR